MADPLAHRKEHTVNIIRSKPRVEYTALPNQMANDPKLSLRALGLLYYILTKPPAWRVIPDQLGARFHIGYRVVLRVLGELLAAGYVKREIVQENNRIVGTRYLVADEPQFGDRAADASAVIPDEPAELPFVDFAACGKSRLTAFGHRIERTESNKHSSLASATGAAPSNGSARREVVARPSRADRGSFELIVAQRIGPNGIDVLAAMPESEVEALCARQRRGTLDDLAIIKLRERYA